MYGSAFANITVLVGHWVLLQRTLGYTPLLLAMILLPAVVFYSPLGFICDKYSKSQVLRWSALASMLTALGAVVLYQLGMDQALLVVVFLLSLLANLHGVARYSILKEALGVRGLAPATAFMQISTLLGTLAASAGVWLGYENKRAISWILLVLSVISWLSARQVPEQKSSDTFQRMRAYHYLTGQYLLRNLRNVWYNLALRQSLVGLSLFWVMVLLLVLLFQDGSHGRGFGVSHLQVALAMFGLILGCLYAARMSTEFIETGLLPIGALGASFFLLALAWVDYTPVTLLLFVGFGFSGGVFVVPLLSLMLYNTRSHTAGGVVATVFFVRGLFVFTFLMVNQGWMRLTFGRNDKTEFLLLGLLTLAGVIYILKVLPQTMIRQLLRGVFTHIYRLRVRGVSNVPWEGPVLLVGNHVSLIDWALLQMACPRPLRIVMARDSFEKWYVRMLLNHLNLILMDPARPEKALEEARKALLDGMAVAAFPEITMSKTGNLNPFRLELAPLIMDCGAVVVPFYIQGLWGSAYSFANARYQESIGGQDTHNVIVAFGATLPPHTDPVLIQRKVQELSIDAWGAYIRTLRPIAHSYLRAAKKVKSGPAIFSPDGNHYSGTRLLAAVLSFARLMEQGTRGEPRVGILLPPSAAGLICNLAALVKGKTIVNLNYSAGTSVIQDCISRAGIATVYSSRLFAERLQQRGIDIQAIESRCKIVYAEDLRASLTSTRLLYNFMRARLLPAWWIELADFSKTRLDDVAAIMFSSGSEGTPKGVELTHYNFMGNVKQVTSVLNPTHEDVMLGSLPMFHAFGLAVTSFMPMVEGIPLVVQPDPTDAKAVGRLCAEFRVTVMVGTSTFLRMYATSKHVHPLMFRHIRLIFAGAEKLRDEVRQLYRNKFQIEIFEGYGTTETTPVASVNTYDILLGDFSTVQIGNKVGSVGTPLPGSQFRVVDPDTMAELPVGVDGLILIGGAQIMKGYLDDPMRTSLAVVTLDGKRWYKTGDKGHVDSEGFLFIVDRYSRFAKLGGEMVSLGAIEQRLGETGVLDGNDFGIVAIPDPSKGEKVVLLYCGDTPLDEVRSRLRGIGLPPLMQPGLVFQVDAVPKLGTGKADFGASKKLAMQLAGAQ